jgi:hypothetical protein
VSAPVTDVLNVPIPPLPPLAPRVRTLQSMESVTLDTCGRNGGLGTSGTSMTCASPRAGDSDSSGLADLLGAAMRACDHHGDGAETREQMRLDCLATPPHLRADLLAYFDEAYPPAPDAPRARKPHGADCAELDDEGDD